ncbi:hypothetical protein [Sulfurimonas sp.]
MSKKIGLKIRGTRFEVDVEEQFADFLELQMIKDFSIDGNNDVKTLLQAYVRKSHELFEQNKKIDEILKKLEE